MANVASTTAVTALESARITAENLDATPINFYDSADDIVLLSLTIDATDNPGQDVYVRFWGQASDSAPTVGTTAADGVFPCKAGQKITWSSVQGILISDGGGAASYGYCACVTDAGAGSGSTSPSGTVDIILVVKEE